MRTPEAMLEGRWAAKRPALIADIIGLLLLCAAATWTFVSALVARSDPLTALILLAMLAIGTISGRLAPGVAPMIVLGAAALLYVMDPLDFVSRDAGSFPFDYENARGAFLVQATAAGIMIARWSRSQQLRTAAITGAIVFALTPFLFGSMAAGLLGLAVIGLSFVTARITMATARLVALGLAVALLATVASTIVLGSAYTNQDDSAIVAGAVDAALSERRRLLWGDAVDALQDDPVLGVGPGNFQHTSALARAEEDVRWVPSIFLEQAAEGGVPGLVLMLLVALWGFGRLIVGGRPGWLVVAGAAALFAVALNASMDYILHFPLVPLVAGAVFGSATSAAWEREE